MAHIKSTTWGSHCWLLLICSHRSTAENCEQSHTRENGGARSDFLELLFRKQGLVQENASLILVSEYGVVWGGGLGGVLKRKAQEKSQGIAGQLQ